MNNNINISLDDVKEFLNTLGYNWNGTIIVDGKYVMADSLNNFSRNLPYLTTMRLHNSRFSSPEVALAKEVIIDPISFTFYNQLISTYDIDETVEYELDHDYSEQWIVFLLQKYGQDYTNYVNMLCKKMRNQTLNKAKYEFEKIKEIKADLLHKLRANLKHYQKIEDLVNNAQNLNIKK